MEEKRLIAKQISKLTVHLTKESLDMISSVLMCTELKKGDFLFREGEICNQIIYVSKGLIRQYYTQDNKEQTENFAYESNFLFEIESCFKQTPSRMNMEALEQTTVYSLPYDKLIKLSVENVEIATFYRVFLEKLLIRAQEKSVSLRFETAGERYRRLMKENPEIIKRAPLSQIASYLMMTPETLSRVRGNVL
ncbi:Crp/Fnr family transcriptional regulator [Parabacteroides sp. OttesenSCG-928-G06]|nr:Crp/Fnr family transcriptional regulator [Parabacteroides sp. OttesenSCG-928-G06]